MSIPLSILKELRKLEIRTRRIVNSGMGGQYHSCFKGLGLNFSEVRLYNSTDDSRRIDWNVTARTGVPYIKLYDEDRELTMMLVADVSGSGIFGSEKRLKMTRIAEIAATLGFSAIRNQDKVGLLLFSDHIEQYLPPRRGRAHMMRLLRDLYCFPAAHSGTDLSRALTYTHRMLKKRSIVVIISDFMDQDYETPVRLLARKHDVVPIIIQDPREQTLPRSGIIALEDNETGEIIFLNTNSREIRMKYKNIALQNQLELSRFFRSIDVNPIIVEQDSAIPALQYYFKHRTRK